MNSSDTDFPEDVVAEDRIADQLGQRYKSKVFGQLRYFLALRRDAPGVIARGAMGIVISAVLLVTAFHDLNAKGIFEVAAVCIAVVLIVALSFWIAKRLWNGIGYSFRLGARFVVSRGVSILVTFLIVVSAVLSLLPTKPEPGSTVTREIDAGTAGEEGRSLTPPPTEIVPSRFEGEDWVILQGIDGTYASATLKDADQNCRQHGQDWALAGPTDFENLAWNLRDAGHVGSFWTAARRGNSNLDFFLDADGQTRFRWAISAKDAVRLVLCVRAAEL